MTKHDANEKTEEKKPWVTPELVCADDAIPLGKIADDGELNATSGTGS